MMSVFLKKKTMKPIIRAGDQWIR